MKKKTKIDMKDKSKWKTSETQSRQGPWPTWFLSPWCLTLVSRGFSKEGRKWPVWWILDIQSAMAELNLQLGWKKRVFQR